MPAENGTALVVRTSDWSETSRIATLFTREFGKVRVVAKGARRLNSSFEVALDLLTVCGIAVIRKNSGLDILTEARVEERFARLRTDLPALYAGYYVAELLGDGTHEHDPHPALYDAALDTLRNLNRRGSNAAERIMGFELVWLQELGYRPRLDACAVCGATEWLGQTPRYAFGAQAGGLICPACEPLQRDRRSISGAAVARLRELSNATGERHTPDSQGATPLVQAELRQALGQFVSFVLGRRPRLLAYLE